MEGIRRRFGTVRALDDASLRLAPGEVHGVLGENGAGKTTLLEILGGHLAADAGRMTVGGDVYRPRSAREAWSRGIGMVHQHFTLVPRLSVLENLALGGRGGWGGFGPLRLSGTRDRARRLMERTGLEVPLDRPLEALGVGDGQRVEILKVLLRDPSILVLDEPTAVLAPPEVAGLLDLVRGLAREGRTVVLVAHKLDEVLAVADRVTVLRRGRTVLEADRAEVDAGTLARAMVGRGAPDVRAPSVSVSGPGPAAVEARSDVGEPVLVLDAVEVQPGQGRAGLRDVTLEVRRGEVVGVAGVEGNGQRELARVATGLLGPDRGRVKIPSEPGFIPQDRRREGLVLDFDLAENLALAFQNDPAMRRGPFLAWRRIRRRAADLLRRFDVRGGGAGTPARSLSGGNQQRVVVARELERSRDLLVAENPTRGLDVAAEAYLHHRLRQLRRRPEPPGILLVSTDLDEVLALSDRVFVMVRGRLLPVPASERTRDAVGSRMLVGDT